jgi:hypothetical protein
MRVVCDKLGDGDGGKSNGNEGVMQQREGGGDGSKSDGHKDGG